MEEPFKTIARWIAAVLVTGIYLVAESTKSLRPKEKLAPQMGWVGDFCAQQVTAIGALDVILPLVTGIAPALTAVAATALVVFQVVAATVHVRRGEASMLRSTLCWPCSRRPS
ncbi:MAG: DoxX family protein [Microbacteriaceae bacterium]|nr:DoxX family protein [Microbacteriaceae bacterium]